MITRLPLLGLCMAVLFGQAMAAPDYDWLDAPELKMLSVQMDPQSRLLTIVGEHFGRRVFPG